MSAPLGRRSVALTAASSVLSRYLGMALTFATFSMIAHRFGSAGLGHYASALGVASTVCYAAGLGAHETPRATATASLKEAVGGAFAFSLLTIFVGLGLFVGILATPWLTGGAALLWTGLWCAAWALNVTSALCLIALGSEKLGALFFYTAGAVCSFSAICVLMLSGVDDASSAIMTSACAYAAVAVAASAITLSRIAGVRLAVFRPTLMTSLVTTGAPFAWARIVQTTALWLPVWIAGASMGPADAGVTSAVMRLAVAAMAAMAAIRLVFRRIMPSMLAAGHRKRLGLLASAVGTLTAGATLMGIVGVLLVGSQALGLVFGSGLAPYKWLLAWALVGTLIEAQFGLAEDMLRYAGHARRLILVQTMSVIVLAIALAVVAVAQLGIYGLITTYVAYVAFIQTVYAVWLRRSEDIAVAPLLNARALRLSIRLRH